MRKLGRYALHDEIASGGMATVYLARQHGEVGFARVVAVKVLHAQYAKEESFRAMFLDEARLVSRIRHPNVIATLDVVEQDGELFLVMEYVHGEALSRLLRAASARAATVPIPIAVAIAIDALEGLHAAHEATAEDGKALDIVHRDVSPQNLIIGVDGATHVADFGIAKAVGRLAEKFSVQHTVKGKAGYMAPEQIRGKSDRRADVFAVGVVLWETLALKRLFTGDSFLEIVTKAVDRDAEPVTVARADASPELAAVVAKALSRDPSKRFASARDMAIALEKCGPRASAREVSEWVALLARDALAARRAQIERIETGRDETAAPRAEGDDPHDASIPGLAPAGSTPRARSWAWVAALAFVIGAGAVTFALRRGAGDAHATTAPRSTADPTASASSAPSAPSVSASASSAPSSSVAPVVPVIATTHTRVRRDAARDAGACHWEQLPDAQGILIPKKVCP